jgi:hypothetical protein
LPFPASHCKISGKTKIQPVRCEIDKLVELVWTVGIIITREKKDKKKFGVLPV